MHSPSAGLVGMRATYDTHKWGSGCTQCAVGQFAGSRGQPSCKTCDWGTWTLGEEPGSSPPRGWVFCSGGGAGRNAAPDIASQVCQSDVERSDV